MSTKRLIIFIVSLLIAGLALGYVAFTLVSQSQGSRYYSDLQEQVASEIKESSETTAPEFSEPETSIETDAPTETEEPTEPFVSPIDFDKLHEINEHVIGWIQIPGTEVDYPVLRHPESENFYLKRNLNGSYGYPGCIYIQTRNDPEFNDFNTIVYGHNMMNGSMFGHLASYRRLDYLESHNKITVYTPTKTLEYTVFAAVQYTDVLIPLEYDLETESGRQEFLDSLNCLEHYQNHFVEGITVTPEDHIITLSTCMGNPNYRYLVLGVLLDEEV